MIIRDFRPSDKARIQEILETSLAHYGLRTSPETLDHDLSDTHAFYIARGGAFRVLSDDRNRILGMYGLRNEGAAVAELRKMYLDPTEKGKGYGKLMLEDAIIVAEGLGFRRMILETNKVLVEAIQLYRSYGFREAGREQYSDRCDYAMSLDLC